ncbi:MAG: branched-chain amino acid ABC transporter permease [Dehalococcoidales bacterium]|nr:branched-chain amino acid ABC transporter permease [Dehalococcoidales bacterium]
MNKKVTFSMLGYSAVIAFLAILPVFFPGDYTLHIMITMGINIVVACNVRAINLTGQMSLAQGGMMTIGAYTSALLLVRMGLNSWLVLIIAGLLTAAVSCGVGYPFTRLKGIYFTMITLLFGQMIITLIQEWRGLTRGSQGIFNIPKPDPVTIPVIGTINIDTSLEFYYLLLAFTVICLLILYAIERSRVGLTFRSIQQADALAESIGVYTTGYKVLAFSLSGFFFGILGAYYSQYMAAVSPDAFGFLFAIYALIYMVVGGSRRFIGPIIGAVVLTLLPEVARPLKQFMPFIYAAILMLIIFFMPEGLVGLPKRLKTAWGHFKKPGKVMGREGNA